MQREESKAFAWLENTEQRYYTLWKYSVCVALIASHGGNFSSRNPSLERNVRVLILYLKNRHGNLYTRERKAPSGAAGPGTLQALCASEIHLLERDLTAPCSGFKECGPSSLLAGCEHHALRSMPLHTSCRARVGWFVCGLRTLAKHTSSIWELSVILWRLGCLPREQHFRQTHQ